MKPVATKFHWIPRILCIIAILFISLFALDAFSNTLTVWQQIKGFLIHLIPSFFLTIILIISWRRELLGGILFLIIGLVLSPFIYNMNYHMNQSIMMSIGIVLSITFPFVVTGVLFIISYVIKKRRTKLPDVDPS